MSASAQPAVRADPFAFLTLFVGGLAGLLQLFLPWQSTGQAAKLTGWRLFSGEWPGDLSFGASISVLAIAIAGAAGGALVILSWLMVSRIDHQPLGVIAMVLSLVWLGVAAFRLVHQNNLGADLGAVFGSASLGLWLFLAGGLVALIGAIKAIGTR